MNAKILIKKLLKQLVPEPRFIPTAALTGVILFSACSFCSLKAHAMEKTDSVSESLEEIVVTAQRPMVTVSDGNINYNVAQDPTAAGSTLIEILRKVPLVTIDGEDNIKVNGQSDYKILINGKEEPMLSQNAKMVLKMMPASMVQKIEVITEPGAKYDAEGCSALLNFITEINSSQQGYNANIQLDFGKQMQGGSGYGRVKYGKVIAGVNASFGTNALFQSNNSSHNEIILNNSDGSPASKMISDAKQKQRFKFAMVGLNLSYEPDKKNLFTFSADFSNMLAKVRFTENNSTLLFPSLYSTSFTRTLDGDVSLLNFTGGINYQHTFSDNHTLSAAYLYNFGNQKINLGNTYYDIIPPIPLPDTNNNQRNINREQTLQVDYSYPFAGGKHILEIGAKGIFRNNTGLGDSYYSGEDNIPEEITDQKSNLMQHQEISSIYASWTGHFGFVTAKAGLRYEHTETRIKNRIAQQGFSSSLNDIVPSASISMPLSSTSQIRASYQWSINRPSISNLNPYGGVEFGGISQQGNPNLKSVNNHKVAVTYSNFGNAIGGAVTLQYTRNDGMITSMLISENRKIIQMPFNIGHSNSPELNAILTWQIINRMSLNFNGSVKYREIIGDSFSNHGWEGTYGINWTYSLTSGYTFNAYGGQGSRSINLQGTSAGWHYYGLSLSKKLLKDRSLTLSFNATNFIEATQSYPMVFHLTDGEIKRTWTSRNWNVGMSISWNFGSMKNLEEKRTRKEIINDDVNKNTNSQSSGGSIGL